MTENTNLTTLDKRCEILADLWLAYQSDSEFKDFIEYCDLALPLAFAINSNIIKIDYDNDRLNDFIHEAFELLIEGLSLQDTGFQSLEDLLNSSSKE